MHFIFSLETSSETPAPLQPYDDNTEPPSVTPALKEPRVSPDKNMKMNAADIELLQSSQVAQNRGPTSPHRTRLSSLARRCQEINNWDDDYSYHSSSHGAQVAVEGSFASPKKLDVHAASASNFDEVVRLPAATQEPSVTGNTNALSNRWRTHSTSSCESLVSDSGGSVSSFGSLSSSSKTPSTPYVAHHPKPQSKLQSPIKTGLSQTATPSPTKKLQWDRGLLNSLVSGLPVHCCDSVIQGNLLHQSRGNSMHLESLVPTVP